jgi:hypothetical protein
MLKRCSGSAAATKPLHCWRLRFGWTQLRAVHRSDTSLSEPISFSERYAEALAACERALADRPGVPFLLAMRAAVPAQMGQLDEARSSAAELRRRQPNFPVAEFGNRFADPAIKARLQAALRKAGL